MFVDSVSISPSSLSCRHTDDRKEIRKFDPIEFPPNIDTFCTISVPQAIQNCVNLRSCTWTHHSFNTPIMLALQGCRLIHLEIAGGPGVYDHCQLLAFSNLASLKLSRPVLPTSNLLRPWTYATKYSLRSLSIIYDYYTVSCGPLFLPLWP